MKLNLEIEITEAEYSAIKKRLNNEQIQELVLQRLKDYAELQFLLPDKLVFHEFVDYLEKRLQKLAQVPPKIRHDMLDTLIELAPTEKWVDIVEITKHFNDKLLNSDSKQYEPYSGAKVGDLLSTLGFTDRKRFHKPCALVRHDILRLYGKVVG